MESFEHDCWLFPAKAQSMELRYPRHRALHIPLPRVSLQPTASLHQISDPWLTRRGAIDSTQRGASFRSRLSLPYALSPITVDRISCCDIESNSRCASWRNSNCGNGRCGDDSNIRATVLVWSQRCTILMSSRHAADHSTLRRGRKSKRCRAASSASLQSAFSPSGVPAIRGPRPGNQSSCSHVIRALRNRTEYSTARR